MPFSLPHPGMYASPPPGYVRLSTTRVCAARYQHPGMCCPLSTPGMCTTDTPPGYVHHGYTTRVWCLLYHPGMVPTVPPGYVPSCMPPGVWWVCLVHPGYGGYAWYTLGMVGRIYPPWYTPPYTTLGIHPPYHRLSSRPAGLLHDLGAKRRDPGLIPEDNMGDEAHRALGSS